MKRLLALALGVAVATLCLAPAATASSETAAPPVPRIVCCPCEFGVIETILCIVLGLPYLLDYYLSWLSDLTDPVVEPVHESLVDAFQQQVVPLLREVVDTADDFCGHPFPCSI